MSKEQGRRLTEARLAAGYARPMDLVRELQRRGYKWQLSRITNYEYGSRNIRRESASVLSRVLGRSVAWFMCVDEETTLAPDEQALIAKYRLSNSKGKRTIQGVADAQSEPDEVPVNR